MSEEFINHGNENSLSESTVWPLVKEKESADWPNKGWIRLLNKCEIYRPVVKDKWPERLSQRPIKIMKQKEKIYQNMIIPLIKLLL